ncbi:MAG: DUF4349 domain-containing protein [Chloroflexi bacterium]|nr:DUF4349 domain-containing protein [Chloroflexota bacterium]
MFTRTLLFGIGLFVIGWSVACAPGPTPVPPSAAPPMRGVASAPTSAPMPTKPPAPMGAPAPVTSAPETTSSGAPSMLAAAADARRKIIKNAQMTLTVESADTAVDRITGIVGDMRGYITSSRTFFEGGMKAATITFAVPVDRFEETLQRVRRLALKVEQESASGQDVTDQYVDLESQVRNLEATADRIRDFLKKAQTVEEALKVNQQLSQVEKEIETIKGKLNYLGDRSAFSTITAEIREPKPTPTPTFTPTITPTPTPTATPTVWNPGQTVTRAVETQTTLMRALTELLIWLFIVALPYALVGAVAIWVIVQLQRWSKRKTPDGPSQPPEAGQ